MSSERPWYARGSSKISNDTDLAKEPKKPSLAWRLDRDWRTTSWWIKGPFLVFVAAFIIATKLGAHFAFEWLKVRWHL
jgi:hypothetical protein